jgi:uncharacterized protein YbjT (DUF2867 family)
MPKRLALFGATGMIGQAVLRECLRDPEVGDVVSIARRTTGVRDGKLREILHSDFSDFSGIAGQLTGLDACIFCLGVSSTGMSEADYRRVTHDVTIAAAETLLRESPGLTFVYVSGTGTDGTERGRSMWARVKGATENALLRMPFRGAYMFRPGYIQPVHGERSSTKWTRALYAVAGPLYPVWKALFPSYVTTTEELARAMVRVATSGSEKRIVEGRDIASLA